MREVHYQHEDNCFTPFEPWTLKREVNHWYSFQADFALESLGQGPGSCLVIGSPVFEALELENQGWSVTYLDVRKPPCGLSYLPGDASTIELPENFYDAVSSTCVLCHAGLGRYGDPIVEDADLKILANIFKTLKSGGKAALTFGPVADVEKQIRLGTTERIYTIDSAKRDVLRTGFRILEVKILDLETAEWVNDSEDFKEPGRIDRHYLSMLLGKCT